MQVDAHPSQPLSAHSPRRSLPVDCGSCPRPADCCAQRLSVLQTWSLSQYWAAVQSLCAQHPLSVLSRVQAPDPLQVNPSYQSSPLQ